MCKEWESLPLLVSWLLCGHQGLYFLSLCLSHKEKSLCFAHWSVTPSLRQAHICSGLGSTGGHRSSPGPGPAPRRTPNIQLPGRFQPQQQGLQSREEDAVPPSTAVLVRKYSAAWLHYTRWCKYRGERKRAVPEGQRNQRGQLCVLMVQQQLVIVLHVTAPFLHSNEEDTIAISTSLRKLKFPHLVRLTFKLTLILEPIFLLMNPLVVNFSWTSKSPGVLFKISISRSHPQRFRFNWFGLNYY